MLTADGYPCQKRSPTTVKTGIDLQFVHTQCPVLSEAYYSRNSSSVRNMFLNSSSFSEALLPLA